MRATKPGDEAHARPRVCDAILPIVLTVLPASTAVAFHLSACEKIQG